MTRVSGRRSRLLQRHWLGLYGVTIVAVFVVIAGIAHRSIVKPGALPASFGRDGKCYYVRSPREVKELKQAGDCKQGSTPAAIPLSWLISYYPFYNSPYYVGTFVAPDDQAGYRSYLRSFGDQYADQIDEQAPTAAYVTSGGSRVTGAQAGINSSDTSISDDDASDGYGNAGAGLNDGGGGGGGDDGDEGDDGGGGDDGGDDGGGGDGGE